MPPPPEPPGTPGTNAFDDISDINKGNDAPDPSPGFSLPLFPRRHHPSHSFSTHEQDEIFNRISLSTSQTVTLAARQEPRTAEGLLHTSPSRSPSRHILDHAKTVEYIKSCSSAREQPGQQREATQLGVGVPGLGTHPLPFSLSLPADSKHTEILPTGPDEALSGTFMITDKHRRDEEEDDDEDEILFLGPTPHSSHASSSRVASASRSRFNILGTTQWEGKDESDSDSDSDGGAPLFTPSEDETLGDSSCEQNRANSNIKTDAQIRHHRRPKMLLASFRPGIPLGVRTEPDADASPEYFSTFFLVKRAVIRSQARALNRFSSLEHPGQTGRLQDGGQQTNDVEGQQSQHQIPAKGRATDLNTNLFRSENHRRHDLIASTSRCLNLPLPTTSHPKTSSSSVLAQSSTLPPRAALPHEQEQQGTDKPLTSSIITQASKPLTTTTPARAINYSRPLAAQVSKPPTATPSSVQLGPFHLSPSTVALLASTQASFERLTTPKFHPAFSSSSSRYSSRQESYQIQASAETWTDIPLDSGPEPGLKKNKEEEGEEEWEWVDNPMDEYRVGRMYNPTTGRGHGRGYARGGGFGRREEEE